MKKLNIFLLFLFALIYQQSNGQTSCTDLNGYVASKNTGGTGSYTLTLGSIEKAAQTYHYSGPGKITSVRVYGNYSVPFAGGVPLRLSVYDVDANDRPTSVIQSANAIWWQYNNAAGYIDVALGGGGVSVNTNFAVVVEVRNAFPFGGSFNLRYTGNGEGRGEDLASLAGTLTGGNWSSAKDDFNKDGDFYIVPRMTHFVTSNFVPSSTCIATASTVSFMNMSQMSRDSMFNKIGLSGYSGGSHYYEWNFGDGSPVSNAVNPSHTFSTAGVYTVSLKSTIMGWNNTCYDIQTMQISVGLSASATNIVNVSCFGSENGSVTAAASGGATPYMYSLNGEEYQSGTAFGNLQAGVYTLRVEDELGCSAQTSFTITQPTAITFAPAANTNASCGNSDGAILVSATGGSGNLQYQLNSGAFQASGSFSGLEAGAYTVTAKDANNCTATLYTAVNDAGAPVLTVMSMTHVSCNGASDGSIVLSASGGSGVLQYSIDGGDNFQTNGSFLNITAGTYSAMVKDASGCSRSMIITINQPQPLSLYTTSVPVSCNLGSDGQIQVTSASGGTGSFSYSINGTVYQSNPVFQGLSAWSYTVYIRDAAGCTQSTTQTVSQPAALSVNTVATPAVCNGSFDGALEITATGGTGNYQYSIYNFNYQSTGNFNELTAGIYTIRVKDENNCTYTSTATITQPTQVTATINTTASTCSNSNGGFLVSASGGSGAGYQFSLNDTAGNSTGLFSNLPSGTYYVLITDGAGCSTIEQATITDANGPSITGTTFTNVACNGGNDGSITVTGVSGGSGTLQYSIDGGAWQASSSFTNLFAGSHTILVKDANGCTGLFDQALSQPSAFSMNLSLVNNKCYGDASGSATVFAAGGSGVLAYSINGFTYQSSNIFNGLSAGEHTIIVRDAAGCNSSVSFTLQQPSAIIVNAGVLNVSCNGAEDGVISVTASGGVAGFEYSLNTGAYQSSNIFTELSGGLFGVHVKDSSGCIVNITAYVDEPAALNVAESVHDVSCAGGSDGSINLSLSGGTAPYFYSWSTGAYAEDIFNLPGGDYMVNIWDENGCFYTNDYTVTEPANPLVINGVVTDVTTPGGNDGAIVTTVTGGVEPYSFLWSNGQTLQNLSELQGATYNVNVTDANGCITSGTFIVESPTGVDDITLSESVNVYPNPATDFITIETPAKVITELKVVNTYGAIVIESKPNEAYARINVEKLSAGVYFIKAKIDGQYLVKRMAISH